MTGLQILVNLVIAVAAYIFVRWLVGYLPDFPDVLAVLLSIVAAVAVFATNVAARLGIR